MPWNETRAAGITAGASLLLLAAIPPACAKPAAKSEPAVVRKIVDAAVHLAMTRYGIPGVSVGITIGGKAWVFNYGVASRETGKPVTSSTLFEAGSVSKTFTATLACWAQERSGLSLSDKGGKYLPSLRGTAFGETRLSQLGTHTPGGFPLQVPDDVTNNDELTAYLARWKPAYKPGTVRTYSNVSIGMLGLITAGSMGEDFTALMEGSLFPALGLKSTCIHVPAARMADYAQGYTRNDVPARMTAAALSPEAYGVKTTAQDMIRFVEANMKIHKLDRGLQRAVTETHTAYCQAGVLTQDLIWEQYGYPVALKTLLRGNSSEMAYQPTPVTAFNPPRRPRGDVWLNKTGSTNGFGAYVAFVPARRIGIVILANKNYPNDARVTMAHQILTRLAAR
jgi:beta-lactamase class C